jgi:hypothetical protein
MQHFSEVIPDVSLNITNRDEELAKPYIRLFQNSPKALKEVKSTLSYFLNEKNKLKRNSIEAKLLQVILNLIEEKKKKKEQSQLPPDTDIYFIENEEIWAEAKNEMNGTETPAKPQSFSSVEYGEISHSAISRRLKTKFKGKPTQSGRGYENKRGFNFSKKVLDKIVLAYESADSIEILPAEDEINENSNINNNNDAEPRDIRVTEVTEVTDSIDRKGIIKDNFDVNESKRTISKEDKDNDSTSSMINSNSSSQINGSNNDNSHSTRTITGSENIESNPHLSLRSVTSVTSVTESRPSSVIFSTENRNGDNNTLLSGLSKIPCIFCNYSNPIRFDLGLHLIEKHRMDLVKLRIGKASMDVRVDHAIELGASRFSIEEEHGTDDKEYDEGKDVNDDY